MSTIDVNHECGAKWLANTWVESVWSGTFLKTLQSWVSWVSFLKTEVSGEVGKGGC